MDAGPDDIAKEADEWGVDPVTQRRRKHPPRNRKKPDPEIVQKNLVEAKAKWKENGGEIMSLQERRTKQTWLINALMSGMSPKACAEFLKLKPKQLQKWMGSAWFREKFEAARRQVMDIGLTRLHVLSMKAISVLEKGMNDEDLKTQLNAARLFFDVHIKWIAAHGVDGRLTEIEEALGIDEHKLGHSTTLKQIDPLLEVVHDNATVSVRIPPPPDVDLLLPGD
jgi:hypothetical protein